MRPSRRIWTKLQGRRQSLHYLDEERSSANGWQKYRARRSKSLIDHIDHIAKVAGVDHVGLGSDFDGVSGATPEGMDSAADLPKITQGLLDRGYSAEDIHKILGGNVLRVFREVERVSREMQAEMRGCRQSVAFFRDCAVESLFAVITTQ